MEKVYNEKLHKAALESLQTWKDIRDRKKGSKGRASCALCNYFVAGCSNKIDKCILGVCNEESTYGKFVRHHEEWHTYNIYEGRKVECPTCKELAQDMVDLLDKRIKEEFPFELKIGQHFYHTPGEIYRVTDYGYEHDWGAVYYTEPGNFSQVGSNITLCGPPEEKKEIVPKYQIGDLVVHNSGTKGRIKHIENDESGIFYKLERLPSKDDYGDQSFQFIESRLSPYEWKVGDPVSNGGSYYGVVVEHKGKLKAHYFSKDAIEGRVTSNFIVDELYRCIPINVNLFEGIK